MDYPSWTTSLSDLWTDYDPARVRFELGLARSVNANAVRVWLGTESWEKSESSFLDHFEDILTVCQELGIMFDSCGVEPVDYTGEVVTLQQAYDKLMRALASTLPRAPRSGLFLKVM